MGQDKRHLQLWGADGPTLLEHTVAFAKQVCNEVIVVLNDPAAWQLDAHIVADVYPHGGALGGIYSGLHAAQHTHAFVVAADMPLLNLALVRYMIAQPRAYDVLLPQAAGEAQTRNPLGVQPLHAIYSRACLGPMQAQLDAGNAQVTSFFEQVRVQMIAPATLRQFDPHGTACLNVNTPDDVARVLATLRAGGSERGH
jgi:molybdopterin-guanine dinucleotide biosynthesis protein A